MLFLSFGAMNELEGQSSTTRGILLLVLLPSTLLLVWLGKFWLISTANAGLTEGFVLGWPVLCRSCVNASKKALVNSDALNYFEPSERVAVEKRMTMTLRERVAETDSWLKIAFIGDSLTRYQYLSLVNYAHRGTYVPNGQRPNPMLEKSYPSWRAFYKDTNQLLEPFEVCDCNRPQKWNIDQTYENRHYLDKHSRISISYIQAFGNRNLHGHFAAEDIHRINLTMQDVFNNYSHALLPAKWAYDWPGALNYVARLHPKPTHVLLNAGFWPNHFHIPEFRTRVISAARRCGFVVIWKKTNYNRGHGIDQAVLEADKAMCELADLCLDLSWTLHVEPKYYWDDKHFLPVIYQAINEHMLAMLKV